MRLRIPLLLAACLAACSTATTTATDGSAEVGQKAENTVGASGGTLATSNGTASVNVPAGALAGDVKLSVSVLSPNAVAAPSAAQQPNTSIESNVYDFGPSGTVFSQPVTITIKALKTAASGNKHVVAVLDGNNVWQALSGSSETNGSVSASTTHFSQYAVASVPTNGAGCAAQADPNYCAPNTCNPSAGPGGMCTTSGGSSGTGGGNPNATASGATNGATQLAFTATPDTAIGPSDNFNVVVAVQDANGNVVDSNSTVAISIASTQGGLLQFNDSHAAVHGYAAFGPLGFWQQGMYSINATSKGLTSPTPATFEVIPGPASPNNTHIVATPSSAAVDTNVTLTLTVSDAAGNHLAGLNPNWTANAGATVTPSGQPTDANGVATAILYSPNAGVVSARAGVESISVLVNVRYYAGGQSAGTSSLYPTQYSANADGVSEIQLQGTLLDSTGTPLSGAVTYTVQGQGVTVTGGATVNNDGSIAPVVTSSVGGLKVVTASAGGQQISTTVFFNPTRCDTPLSQPVQPVLNAPQAPASLVQADFNGDGVTDMATANYIDNSMGIFIGNANGTFGNLGEYSINEWPVALAAGDLNGDTFVDVVVVSNSRGTSILLGKGDGTFHDAVNDTAYHPYEDVALVDVDHDTNQYLDMVVARDDGGFGILIGNGDGTFQDEVAYLSGSEMTRTLAVADLDGDGFADVTLATQFSISYSLNNEDGTFGQGAVLANINQSPSVVAADVTGDGQNDVLAVDEWNQIIRPFINIGSGFSEAANITIPYGTRRLVLADVNADQNTDILLAAGSTVGIMFGDNGGNFTLQPSVNAGPGVSDILAFDYDSDGHVDLEVANGGERFISLIPGVGDGTFPKLHSQSVGNQPVAVVSADLNGDAATDVVLAFRTNVAVMLNDGHGTLQTPQPYTPAGSNPNITGIVLADVTADGNIDIVLTSKTTSGTVEVLAGAGDGTFGNPASYPAGNGTQSLAVGDINGDGTNDVVAANAGDGNVVVFTGDPNSGQLTLAGAYAGGTDPESVVLGNLDKDFTLDVAVVNASGSTVSVLLNSNSGLTAAVTYNVGTNPTYLAVSDINADYVPDLIVANTTDKTVSLLVNDGNGVFTNPNTLSPDITISGITVIDLNADANNEIILIPGNSGHPLVMFASGYQGYFVTTATYNGPTGVMGTGDINGDGYPDFIMVDASGNLTVLLNAGCGRRSMVGVVSAKQSSIIASPNTVVADGSTQAVIAGTLNDLAGHPIAGLSLSFTGNNSDAITFTPNPFTTDNSGNFSVTATSTLAGGAQLMLQQGQSNTIWFGSLTFTPGPATTLQVHPPLRATAGQTFETVSVTVVDAHGNPTNSNTTITLSSDLGNGATLTGTLSQPAPQGEAEFSDLSTTANGNITITASAPGLTDGTAYMYVNPSMGGGGGGGGNTGGNTGGSGNTGAGAGGNTGSSPYTLGAQVTTQGTLSAGNAFAVQVSLTNTSDRSPANVQDNINVQVWSNPQTPVGSPFTCSLQSGQCTANVTISQSGSYTLIATDSLQPANVAAPVMVSIN